MYNEQLIEDFRVYLLHERNLSFNTADSYMRDLFQFDEKMDGKDFLKIEDEDVKRYIVDLRLEGLSVKSTNRKLSALKTFYGKYLKKNKLISHNPAEGIDSGKLPKSLPKPIDEEDIELLFRAVSNHRNLRDMVIFEVLYGTGVRRYELAKMKVKDINFNRQYIRVLGKGEKERTVPLNDAALDLIKQLIVQNGATQWLFPSKQYKNRCISTRRINEIITFYVQKAGLEDKSITPHKFRHSFCSHLFANGADLKSIQAWAGHEKADTTNLYTKLNDERSFREYQMYHPRSKRA